MDKRSSFTRTPTLEEMQRISFARSLFKVGAAYLMLSALVDEQLRKDGLK